MENDRYHKTLTPANCLLTASYSAKNLSLFHSCGGQYWLGKETEDKEWIPDNFYMARK